MLTNTDKRIYDAMRVKTAFEAFTENKPEIILAVAWLETHKVYIKTEAHC